MLAAIGSGIGPVAGSEEIDSDSVGYGEVGFGEGGYGGTTIRAPSITSYTDTNDIVQTEGLLTAINDWRGGTIDTSVLLDVINAWQTGNPVE